MNISCVKLSDDFWGLTYFVLWSKFYDIWTYINQNPATFKIPSNSKSEEKILNLTFSSTSTSTLYLTKYVF
jgi:hypothetical protein